MNLPIILHADEKQPLGGRCGTGLAAVFGEQDLGEPVRGVSMAANFDQGADDVADHVVEKAVGGDFNDDFVKVHGGLSFHEDVSNRVYSCPDFCLPSIATAIWRITIPV